MVHGGICLFVTVIPIEIRKRSTPLLDNSDSDTSIFFEMPLELVTILNPQFPTNACWDIRLVSRDLAFGVCWIVTHGWILDTLGQNPSADIV
ncbi:hypothetical protein AUR66_18325 [Haloferax profundi]|uniref:Uncharacterized protein n=1 Tax=Haloferax profundi TaxID=1544718 RepID=A0A0W1RWW7_9EURY|nr:hypothetical protein AUR66_18325 [Haloferax profundi]